MFAKKQAKILFDQLRLDVTEEAAIFVPIAEHDLYLKLAAKAAHEIQAAGCPLDLMLVDRCTLTNLQMQAEVLPQAQRTGCLGAGVAEPAWPEGVQAIPCPPALRSKLRVLLALSSHVNLLMLGMLDDATEAELPPFCGGWSTQRDQVTQAAAALMGCTTPPWFAESVRRIEAFDVTVEQTQLTMKLMQYQAQALAIRQQEIAHENADIFYVLNSLYTIAPHQRVHEILYTFVQQVAKVVGSDRCSIVQIRRPQAYQTQPPVQGRVAQAPQDHQAYVLASHEDMFIDDYPLELDKYPELRYALETHSKVLINQAQEHAITRGCAAALQQARIASLLVIPMVLSDPHVGTLFLRTARRFGTFEQREVRFLEVISEAAGNALVHAQLFSNMQQTNLQLEYLSRTDGLTGLHNYRHFLEQFESEFLRAQRYRIPLSFLLFDIDDFKRFNDTYGHLMGDAVLRELATRTRNAVRQSDFIARYGGEEFVIILPHTPLEGALEQAERLLRLVADTPFIVAGKPHRITISIGASCLEHGAMTRSEAIIRQADEALYRAKSAGKNRACGPGVSNRDDIQRTYLQ